MLIFVFTFTVNNLFIMAEPRQKIHFGFSKSLKSNNVPNKNLLRKKSDDKQYITSVEDKAIIGKTDSVQNTTLTNSLQTDKPSDTAQERNISDHKTEYSTKKASNDVDTEKLDTLDKLAVQELLKDAKNFQVDSNSTGIYAIQIAKAQERELANVSTLEDYDAVPISDFGLAMLRGMGWNKGEGIGKNKKIVKPPNPELRAKGLGLGASRDQNKSSDVIPPANKQIVPGSFVTVRRDTEEDLGKVISLDEDTGRLIVEFKSDQSTLSVPESRVSLISKEEYFRETRQLGLNKSHRRH